MIELALEAMVTRSRDLEVFGYGDPRDVRIVDDGEGLQFACIGVLPERRSLLHASYAYLTLRNGIPIGYVQADALCRGAAVSYNTFETFRGGEAAHVFGRMLAVTRHLLGAESFSIEPYQLGHGNAEAIDSGAWWFYYKLGFRPVDPGVRRIVRRELARIERNPRYRSSAATLEKLATKHLFFGREGRGPHAPPPPWNEGAWITAELAARGGADREGALEACSREASRLLGLGPRRGWTSNERRAWTRWAPLIPALPGVSRWSPADRRALARVARAKGGRRDSDFVAAFDAHPRLARVLLRKLDR